MNLPSVVVPEPSQEDTGREFRNALRQLFKRFFAHGCSTPWKKEDKRGASMMVFDYHSALRSAGVGIEDLRNSYGRIMACKALTFRRVPSPSEVLEAINKARPEASDTAIQAEGMALFGRIVAEIEAGRARALDTRVRETYGLAAAEAWAAIGGTERMTEDGSRDYRGAARTSFCKAYQTAAQGGRTRADVFKALPAAPALPMLTASPLRGLIGISQAFPPTLESVLNATPPAIPPPMPQERYEARLMTLRRQAQSLQSVEATDANL